jgi:hypothetical protein
VLGAAYLALQPPPARAVHGIVVDVTSSTTVRDDDVTLLADDGSRVTLEVDPEVTLGGGSRQALVYLRERLILGTPVLVCYRETRGGPLALLILDD